MDREREREKRVRYIEEKERDWETEKKSERGYESEEVSVCVCERENSWERKKKWGEKSVKTFVFLFFPNLFAYKTAHGKKGNGKRLLNCLQILKCIYLSSSRYSWRSIWYSPNKMKPLKMHSDKK